MTRSSLTDEHYVRISELAQAGFSVSQISRETGRSVSAISRYVRRRGIEVKTQPYHRYSAKRDSILRDLRRGMTAAQVAERNGCTRRNVHKIAAKHGTPPLRSRKQARRYTTAQDSLIRRGILDLARQVGVPARSLVSRSRHLFRV